MADLVKNAVVTGASSGIGRAIALRLAGAGYRPFLIGRNAGRLSAVAAEAERLGRPARCFGADLSRGSQVERLGADLIREVEAVDVLVHGAGISVVGTPIPSAGEEVLEEQFRVNVLGPYLLTRALLPCLRIRTGQVVFINSTAGLHGKENVAAYSMSKHALRALADSLREEVNRDGIRVLSVFLGRTATPMQARIHLAENRDYRPQNLLQPEDVAAVIAHSLSLAPTAEVTDVHIRPMMKTY